MKHTAAYNAFMTATAKAAAAFSCSALLLVLDAALLASIFVALICLSVLITLLVLLILTTRRLEDLQPLSA